MVASAHYLSDARYITAKLRNRMREKPLRYLKKKEKKPERYNLVTYSFSNLFMVFSFRFIQLIASCRQSSRAHYRTLTGSIVRKLID